MKTLFIVRHGKSSWDYDDISDIDRPLNERGIRDGYKMAGRLKKSGRKPGMIISSPAARALHTAIIFQRTLGISDRKFILDRDLYEAETEDIMEVIFGVDDGVESVMIFSHNPTVHRSGRRADHPGHR